MQKGPFISGNHALLKFFQKEKGYEKVVHLLEEIRKTGSTKYINAINLGKIIYPKKKNLGTRENWRFLQTLKG